MDEEENIPQYHETYDMMLRLEQLESLREDLEESGFNSLSKVEAALALTVPGANPETEEKRTWLTSIRADLLELGLADQAEVEAEIDRINSQLDEDDKDF
ncbi:MAG: hypothetical protein JWP00_2851 [Chloroflexi bacterium]|jgi:hypothetical protein|nr:hypothetical protein [Chloroflexota bacterium]